MHEINALLGADRKHKSRDRPIVEVNQLRCRRDRPREFTWTSTDLPPPSRKRDSPQGRRNRFQSRRNAPETDICWICFQSNSGVDPAGHHHQPLLSAVLQGGIVCHPNAESLLGLSFQAEGRAPEACRVCTKFRFWNHHLGAKAFTSASEQKG